jgi:2-phospho-L-lactate guanylyltransferase
MGLTAIVPVKALHAAKGRMAGELDPLGRRELVSWMLDRVLAACAGARSVERTLVVAGDAASAALVAGHPVDVVIEVVPGLAAAMATGDRVAGGATATLVVAADLPLATAADLQAVCDAGSRSPCVVVVPTRDGGTGALLRRPAGVVGTAFGPGSAAAHLRLAAAARVPGRRLEIDNLAFDVDTPRQLGMVRARWRGGPGE